MATENSIWPWLISEALRSCWGTATELSVVSRVRCYDNSKRLHCAKLSAWQKSKTLRRSGA